jgi:Zn-finger nucleic acid-binding protein
MACPSCGDSLAPKDYHGVTVDECKRCRGLWFERDELRRAKDDTDEYLRWLDFDVFSGENKFDASPGTRNCPKCSQPMSSLKYMHSTVQIDACDQDHGVWLDRGEFGKIIAYLEKLENTMSAKEYRRSALTEFKEILTGPESQLSEVKDFLAVVRLLRMRISVENLTRHLPP